MARIEISNACSKATRMLAVALVMLLPIAPALGHAFSVELWPNGVVWYRFVQDLRNDPAVCSTTNQIDLELCDKHKKQVLLMMDVWETALRVTDPLGNNVSYVQFRECTVIDCPTSHVIVRYNHKDSAGNLTEENNMCTYRVNGDERVGRNPDGPTELHFKNVDSGNGKVQADSIVLHELGHCLGLWHEQNRDDHVRWVEVSPTQDYCANNPDQCDGDFWNADPKPDYLMPRLGNYDYDSIMHYSSFVRWKDKSDNNHINLHWADPLGNTFFGANSRRPPRVSPRDISRVLQFQAYAHDHGNGFFQSLSVTPLDPDLLPNPYLDQAARISAVGSPAIAYQSPGNYDVFARGTDLHVYWKSFQKKREVIGHVNGKPVFWEHDVVGDWRSIGCCFASDPSAVSRGPGMIDVVAVTNSGAVQRIKHVDGIWSAPLTLRGGSPTGGIKSFGNFYVGPAIASRASNLLDVFIVRADGRLAVTTWRNGIWEAWQTLVDKTDYDVAARPAALALSGAEVQLAINDTIDNLYLPSVTFGAVPPSFVLGAQKGKIELWSPPALTTQVGPYNNRYRVLVTNQHGRISMRSEFSAWRDIGGIANSLTGPAAVATGDLAFMAVMNGEDAEGCHAPFCDTVTVPTRPGATNTTTPGEYIQPGGLWIRYFD